MSRDDRELDELMTGWPDDERQLVGKLRALRTPPEGEEPPWLEQQIRRAVDAEAARRERRWLARLWRPVLGVGLVVAAVATVILVQRPPPASKVAVAVDGGVRDASPSSRPPEPEPLALGAEGDIAVEDLDDEIADVVADELALTADTEDDAAPEVGLVPDLALDWVDDLDDEELDAVVAWLDERG